MPSSKATGEVLRGVSNRFSAFHPDKSLRRQGALVAAAFAKLMMGDGGDESDEPRFEEFPSVLQEWDAEEQRQLPVGSGIPATAPVVEARVSQAVDAAVCQYPIDPDMRLVCVIRLPCHQYSAPPSEKRTTVEDSHRGGGGLRFSSVGVTEFPADGNDSLDHLRHIYSELLGMGDKNRQNETEHEAFDRVSSAMRSLPTVLQHLVNRSRLPNASSVLGQSIVMLLPGLFTSLFCFSHACPKDVEEELRVCRNKAALLLFSLNPKGALSSLSTLLYGSGTSVACKTELCTLVGDAVEILSAIPLAPPQTSPSSEAKHLVRYPPIGASTQAPKGQGFNTRRWGYAAHHVAGNVFSNEAADIAADVLQLFVKHADASEGGYSFEGDDMMFTPVEMLRAIGKLFASIALVRHVTPVIAPKALSFLQRFVLHALPLVRANAWMAIEKCMSSWRGFGARACSPDWAAAVLQVSGIATTLLSRENVPFVKSAILFFLQSVEGHVQDQLAN
jgi:hypothetical protein